MIIELIDIELIPYTLGVLLITAFVYFTVKQTRKSPSTKAGQSLSKWSGDLDDTAYLYYQGMNASQTQATRYVEGNTLVLSTGEVATCRQSGVNTIPRARIWLFPESQEVQRHTKIGATGRLEHLIHGIKVKRPKDLPYQPMYPTNESGTLHHYSINPNQCSLGQKTDIRDHKLKFDALIQANPNIRKVVLYGPSRGAATHFSALAEHQYKLVKLVVLEAAPSSMSGIIKSYAARIPGLRGLGKYLYNKTLASIILGNQHVFDKKSQARGHVESFPTHVPLVVISSLKDGIVPAENTIRLALRVAAHRINSRDREQPVYFLLLEDAGHNTYSNSQRYNNFIHAVYKRHGLPFDERAAREGEKDLEKADLLEEPNRSFVIEQTKFWRDKPHREAIRSEAFDQLAKLRRTKKVDNRQLDVFQLMPLFSKPIEHSLYFFPRNPVQSKLKALKEERASYSLS